MSDTSLLPIHDPDPLLQRIGGTPLIPLTRVGAVKPGVRIFAKAEWFNPGGSVKDRAAYRMLRVAELSGELTADKTVLDSTSGNTGIAYAMICARRGYRCKLLMPANASTERKKLLKAYGADVTLTDPAEGSDGSFFAARELYEKHPDQYFYPDQYGNPQNPQAHYETTAPEVWDQTCHQLTHFIAGLGTSGTLLGSGRRLREIDPKIQILAMQPDSPFHGLEGLKHMATTSHVPDIFDPAFADGTEPVATEAAQAMACRLTREEGLYVGISAGAAVCAALQVAARIDEGTIVTVCPDGGARYQSETFWDTFQPS